MSGANVQTIPTGLLVQEYREVLMSLKPDDTSQVRRSELLEEEILRRMAW